MTSKQFFSLLILFFVTACSSLGAVEINGSVDSNPIPVRPTVPVVTETQTVIPEYMNEYLRLGLDKVNNERLLCFVIDESKIHLAPLGGIALGERIVHSWVEVDYFQDGNLEHSNVLVMVRRGGATQKDFNKFVFSNSGSGGAAGTVAFYESVHKAWAEVTPDEEHPIACGILGLKPPAEIPTIAGIDFEELTSIDLEKNGVNLLFQDVFPEESGQPQQVWVNGIGRVLPVTQGYLLIDMLAD